MCVKRGTFQPDRASGLSQTSVSRQSQSALDAHESEEDRTAFHSRLGRASIDALLSPKNCWLALQTKRVLGCSCLAPSCAHHPAFFVFLGFESEALFFHSCSDSVNNERHRVQRQSVTARRRDRIPCIQACHPSEVALRNISRAARLPQHRTPGPTPRTRAPLTSSIPTEVSRRRTTATSASPTNSQMKRHAPKPISVSPSHQLTAEERKNHSFQPWPTLIQKVVHPLLSTF